MLICRRFGSFVGGSILTLLLAAGCGYDRVQPTLPAAFPNFALSDLEAIQGDERLTVDQRRAAIRNAINAPLTPEGDRLVEFLLNFPVP